MESDCVFKHGLFFFSVQLSTLFSFHFSENDDMESSKRSVKLLSLIFIIRCLTKSYLIRIRSFIAQLKVVLHLFLF